MQPIPVPILVLIFIFGLLIGSFLNVCIYRIPLGLTVVQGRSMCPHCGTQIPWYWNVPLLSFLLLKGRCRYCQEKISPIYPAVEFLNAVLTLLAFLVYGLTLSSLFFSLLFSCLVVISFIDLGHKIIPDGLVLVLLILGMGFAGYQVLVLQAPWSLFAIGFFAASLPLFILGYFYQDGIGGGDIKLMAVVGLFLGWKLVLLALFLASLFGLFYAGILAALHRVNRRSVIPFGPFLSLGILVSTLFGHQILSLYFSLFFTV